VAAETLVRQLGRILASLIAREKSVRALIVVVLGHAMIVSVLLRLTREIKEVQHFLAD